MLDLEVNDQLVAAAEVEEGDVVLEIGPGTGSLTNVLINAGANVLAIKKVLQEDFVKCHIFSHMSSLLRSIQSSGASPRCAKVVTNIPCYISTDVVRQLLPMGDIFSEVVLSLQVASLAVYSLHKTSTRDHVKRANCSSSMQAVLRLYAKYVKIN